VTHDQAEALLLGDRIAVIDKGRLQQTGAPDEICHRPTNAFVAEFFDLQEIYSLAEKFRSQRATNAPAPDS